MDASRLYLDASRLYICSCGAPTKSIPINTSTSAINASTAPINGGRPRFFAAAPHVPLRSVPAACNARYHRHFSLPPCLVSQTEKSNAFTRALRTVCTRRVGAFAFFSPRERTSATEQRQERERERATASQYKHPEFKDSLPNLRCSLYRNRELLGLISGLC
eukprot:3601042-Rhodomonas_salina.1